MSVEYLTVRDLIEQLQRIHPWELTDVTDIRWLSSHLDARRVHMVPGHPIKEEIADLEAHHRRILAEIADTQRRLSAKEQRSSYLEAKIQRLEKRLSTLGRLVAQRRPALP